MTREELYNYIKKCPERLIDDKINSMVNDLLKISNCPADKESELKCILRLFKSDFKQKWTAAHSIEERFTKNAIWLTGTVKLQQKSGRPKKEFGESSDQELRERIPESMNDTHC